MLYSQYIVKSNMLPSKTIYEGKAKSIIKAKDPLIVIQYFKDDVTAFNKKNTKLLRVRE